VDPGSDGELCESGDLWSAAVHEAGHVRIGQLLEGVQVNYARAKASGTGTTKFVDEKNLTSNQEALIAVGGVVAESLVSGEAEKPPPPNDRTRLTNALPHVDGELSAGSSGGDPTEIVKVQARALLENQRAELIKIATVLKGSANVTVTGGALDKAVTD